MPHKTTNNAANVLSSTLALAKGPRPSYYPVPTKYAYYDSPYNENLSRGHYYTAI